MTNERSFTVFSIFLISVLFTEASPSSRILGGTDTQTGKYSWVASIRVDGIHSCSGSIINNNFIITAARCVSPFENFRVTARVGSGNQFAGGQLVEIKSIFIHPSFGNFLHDIALLKVNKPFTFNDKINTITLASRDDVIVEGSQVFVTGWGLKENGSTSYKLQHLSLSILSEQDCERQAGYGYNSVTCLTHLNNTGICQGDEGAGIVSGTKLVAVASFYFGNCGTKYPDVASNISFYSTWINEVIEKN